MRHRLLLPIIHIAASVVLLGCAGSTLPSATAPIDPDKPRGRLPPEDIQRVVRARFGDYRRCYEDGLTRSPGLRGRVSVRFVIERDGAVSQVRSEGSDMRDAAVVACVVAAFERLRFPSPSNGTVTVTYPLMFDPQVKEAPSPPGAASPGSGGSAGPPPSIPGVVRLHVDSPVEAELVEHLGVHDTEYRPQSIQWMEGYRRICVTPCDAVVDGRAGHSFTLESPLFPESEHFVLSERMGDLEITLQPGDEGLLNAGRWMTALGGVGALFGTVALPLSFASDESTAFKAGSAGALACGAALLAGGIVLLIRSRTHLRFEPPVQAKAPALFQILRPTPTP